MRIGAHLSISGGMAKMARTAVEVGCECVQIFSRSPRGGKAKELSPSDVAKMQFVFKDNSINPLVIHAPYFLNLAAKEERKKTYSMEVLLEELQRAQTLGASYVVTHIGHREKDEEEDSPHALERVSSCTKQVLEEYRGPVRLLFENTANVGRQVGNTLEALSFLLSLLPEHSTGICFDTCHAFAAGYDLGTAEKVEEFLSAFDKIVGLKRLFAIHLNDSKEDLGSKKDRHAHIGKGKIGDIGLKAFINSRQFPRYIPALLETPGDYKDADKDNINHVKSLRNS